MADPIDDPFDPQAAIARNRALAGDNQAFHDVIAAQVKTAMSNPALPGGWLAATGVPRNVGIGAYKAALNIIETGADMVDAAAEVGKTQSNAVAGAVGAEPIEKLPTVRELFPGFFENAHAFADALTADNKVSDDLVQGVAQFALPFAGYLKLVGGLKGAALAEKVARGAMAEGAAAASAFDPEEGRLADLVQLGRESEGRFGDLLRKVAPDGSLVNQYIDYMTSRGGSRIEGRFKNAVDSLVGSAALAGMLKTAATSFRAARKLAAEPLKVGRAAQRGSVGVEDELTDIERARALKNTEVVEGGEHVVLEGDTLNTNADVVPIRPENK